MYAKAFAKRILISSRNAFIPVFKVNFSPKQCTFTVCSQGHCSFSTSSVANSGKKEIDELFPLKYLFLKTSVDLWEECPQGLSYDVGYKDSQPLSDFNKLLPTIVGVPGIMGTHEELSDLLLPFAKLGYRVLIPNLPGNKYTRGLSQPDEDIFTYGIDERTEFVNDFLDELGITRVDLLVTNHCAVYPGLKLTLRNPDKYRSLVMINPAGVRPTRIMQPVNRYQLISRLWDAPYIRVFLKLCLFLVKPFTKHKGWKVRDVITFSRSIAGTSYEEVEDLVQHATMNQRPRFVIYSDNDKLFDTEIIEEMINRIGIPESAIQVIKSDKPASDKDSNQNASSVKPSAIDISNIKGVKFEGAVGDIKMTKASLIKKILWDCLKAVKPGS